ncbi:ECF transporter S component [Proteiniclasticum ruminis]|uniref:ECF transporter S component n=1 Tax=Proteiniclasticum ruminis TaxID=398199 RepID=UPI00289750A1|nr:ECF transporter S component [Proteiniclasticum ruminis]
MKSNIRTLTYTALMTAFVFITTSVIKIPIPFTNGYIHAGDTAIFLGGILLGPVHGAVAAGIGSAMADLLGGYAHWALPTLLIKGLMGFIVGYFSSEKRNQKHVLWGTSLIWIGSLFAFIYTAGNTTLETIMENVEGASSIALAGEIVKNLNTQLLVVAIGLPLLSLILFKLKDRYGITFSQLVGMIVAGIVMVLGYYVASGIIYGNFLASIFSVPWNIVQFGIGGILAFVINAGLSRSPVKRKILQYRS